MRIGILTCHSSLNYGANLQVYSTSRVLEKMGHNAFVYDNRDVPHSPCRKFIEQHVTLTNPCRIDEEFQEETLRLAIDCILVGSDAVLWLQPGKKKGHGAYPNPFWLRWARDLPVRKALIAASSMGIMFPLLSRRLCSQLKSDLDAFDYISVRDQWSKYFLGWIGSRKVEMTFDPTSALPELFAPFVDSLPDGLEKGKYYVFTFSNAVKADPWLKSATALANEKGMKTCFISHPDRLCSVEHTNVCISEILDPLDWLSILASSAGYVGERFHPVVLSRFYSIPFLSCDYYSQTGIRSVFNCRSKTRDFCRRVGTNRIVFPSETFFQQVSPEFVLKKLEQRQGEATDALQNTFVSSLHSALASK